MTMFDEEAGGGRLNPADCIEHTCPGQGAQTCTCLGHLLMVWAVGYIDHSPTKYSVPNKNSDVIVVDVVDLDQEDEEGYQGKIIRSVWWRNARLIGFLKGRIGRPKPVLAWMGLGVATMGKPPYELHPATSNEDAVTRAAAWFAAHPDFRPTSPQGHNPEAARIPAEAPQQREPSQLEQMARMSMPDQARDPHQAGLRQAVKSAPLPPPRPATIADEDIPF